MALEARRLEPVDSVFGIQAASRMLVEGFAPWVQDLGMAGGSDRGRTPGRCAA